MPQAEPALTTRRGLFAAATAISVIAAAPAVAGPRLSGAWRTFLAGYREAHPDMPRACAQAAALGFHPDEVINIECRRSGLKLHLWRLGRSTVVYPDGWAAGGQGVE